MSWEAAGRVLELAGDRGPRQMIAVPIRRDTEFGLSARSGGVFL